MIDSKSTPHRWDYHYNEPSLGTRFLASFGLHDREQREIDWEKIANLAVIAAWDDDE